MKRIVIAACALTLASAAVFAFSADAVVKQREEVMKEYEDYLKLTGKMFRGQKDYDVAVVKSGAEALQAHAGSYLLDLFPKGSDAHSKAKPLIWEQWDDYADLANSLQASAAKLAANSATMEAAAPYYKEVASSCKGCHKTYKGR